MEQGSYNRAAGAADAEDVPQVGDCRYCGQSDCVGVCPARGDDGGCDVIRAEDWGAASCPEVLRVLFAAVIEGAARAEGAERGKAAGTWVEVDSEEVAMRHLRMIGEGDPEWWAHVPTGLDLSGEWADGPSADEVLCAIYERAGFEVESVPAGPDEVGACGDCGGALTYSDATHYVHLTRGGCFLATMTQSDSLNEYAAALGEEVLRWAEESADDAMRDEVIRAASTYLPSTERADEVERLQPHHLAIRAEVSGDWGTDVVRSFLERVQSGCVEALRYRRLDPSDVGGTGEEPSDVAHEVADGCVPIYTGEVFDLLAAARLWAEDVEDFGPFEDVEQHAKACIYVAADRLAMSLLTSD